MLIIREDEAPDGKRGERRKGGSRGREEERKKVIEIEKMMKKR